MMYEKYKNISYIVVIMFYCPVKFEALINKNINKITHIMIQQTDGYIKGYIVPGRVQL